MRTDSSPAPIHDTGPGSDFRTETRDYEASALTVSYGPIVHFSERIATANHDIDSSTPAGHRTCSGLDKLGEARPSRDGSVLLPGRPGNCDQDGVFRLRSSRNCRATHSICGNDRYRAHHVGHVRDGAARRRPLFAPLGLMSPPAAAARLSPNALSSTTRTSAAVA